MALYFGLPFAVYALSLLMQKASVKYKGSRVQQIGYVLLRLLLLLAIFIMVNALLWYPWLSKDGMSGLMGRIFPIRRGLFEDKVASFWCVLNNFYKVGRIDQ
jgi:alpha-1,3-glucosyltransferase